MKKIKEHKFRFGVLDVVIIIIVVALISSVVLRFTTEKKLFTYETEKYTVSLKSCGIMYTAIDMISSSSNVYFENGDLFGVLLHSPTVTPMLSYSVTSTGEIVAAYFPDNTFVDIIAEIECDLVEKDGSVMTASGVHIAPGIVLVIHTPTVELTVEIIGLEKQIIE